MHRTTLLFLHLGGMSSHSAELSITYKYIKHISAHCMRAMQIIQIYHKDPHGVFKFRSLRARQKNTCTTPEQRCHYCIKRINLLLREPISSDAHSSRGPVCVICRRALFFALLTLSLTLHAACSTHTCMMRATKLQTRRNPSKGTAALYDE
jgi:hypothetical protein